MTTFHEDAGAVITTMPGSPPDLTGSKSSKSSSFHSSYQSDDHTILSDAGHFEDIGLGDDARAEAEIGDFAINPSNNPYDSGYTHDSRQSARHKKRSPTSTAHGSQSQRELTGTKSRPPYPSLSGQVRNATTDALGLMPIGNGNATLRMGPTSPKISMMRRNRSSSPNMPTSPRQSLSATSLKTRRLSWQSNRERKTPDELEKECDDDDGDDVPDECFLQNIPISPRPTKQRTPSASPSVSTSPERPPKEKVKNLGNGTSPRPAEQGFLGSPKPGITRNASMGQFPAHHDHVPKARAKSWTDALSELSKETKALTQALEEHADDEEANPDLTQARSFSSSSRSEKMRVQSAIAELPPLRRTDFMIDPLPISKEKEAVLSRTRPSWLPPKDPAEEKRHLKEYQRMMAQSLEVERKKEVQKHTKSACRDETAESLLRIWEEHVLPHWDIVIRQKRTRELWWRGIAPRSRGQVWEKAIGNELGLAEASYNAALRRAQALEKTVKRGSQLSVDESKKKVWLDNIEADVQKTYPELRIFQSDGPLHMPLGDVLKAYAMYRSDVGYVHGTSTIAALLLLNLPSASASFCALSNILNRPLPLSFHTSDNGATKRGISLLLSTLSHKSPSLHKHLTDPKFYPALESHLHDLFASLLTFGLNLDQATRLWDVMVFEGDAVVVRAGVAYLTSMEGRLFGTESSNEILDVMNRGLQDLSEDDWITAVREAGKS